MYFKNKNNNQVASLSNPTLIDQYINDIEWEIMTMEEIKQFKEEQLKKDIIQ